MKMKQRLRWKVGSASSDSVLISNLNFGPSLEFEKSDATRTLWIALAELPTHAVMYFTFRKLPAIMAQTQTGARDKDTQPLPVVLKSSELFEHRFYLPEVSIL